MRVSSFYDAEERETPFEVARAVKHMFLTRRNLEKVRQQLQHIITG